MSKKTEYYINAINSLIHGQQPMPELGSCINKLYKLSKAHDMSIMIEGFIRNYYPECITDKMKEETAIRTALHFMQKSEYRRIVTEFENQKIKYIPLKGILLCELYPKQMVREMSDIDILVNDEDINKVIDIMLMNGYKYQHCGHHEVFKNQNGICFEIHTKLIDEKRNNKLENYFEDVWNFALKSGTDYRYILSPEDEYIYLIAHIYGHFHMGGCGVRYILDIWIYLQKNCNMNFEKVNKVLKKYKMQKFADNISRLGMVWFAGEKTDEIMNELSEYIIDSGIYGRTEQYSMAISDESKIPIMSVLRRKLFLDSEEMKKRYPWIKFKPLVTVGYIYRTFDIVINEKAKIGEYIKTITNIDKQKVIKYKQKMNKFGI